MNQQKTAYILLWFPKPSETFVFKEVMTLRETGFPVYIYTLYGEIKQNLSPEMRAASKEVTRLGIKSILKILSALKYWLKKDLRKVSRLFKSIIFKPFYGFEKTGENIWAFFCALYLARCFESENFYHIHAPWASGPATAAWVASKLTNIPFSFTARAWDIYTPDNTLQEKIQDASLIRCETKKNVRFLSHFIDNNTDKIQLTYNSILLKVSGKAPVLMTAPYRFLAIGRFVGKKGYEYLIRASEILKDAGMDFQLTLAGDGPLKGKFTQMAKELNLMDNISFPGFVPHDHISMLFHSTDIFIMPSVVHASGDRDGLPTVIMESLLHGVPVISTDVSGISELIENDVTGVLIPEKDSQAIAQAINRTIANRQMAIDIAENGRKRVLEKFDSHKNINKVLHLYEKFIFSPQRSA